jgi:hypothetical protein
MEQMSNLAQVFNDSYDRVMHGTDRKRTEFFAEFYNLFIATSEEAACKFRNVDMATQVGLLQASVSILLAFFVTRREDKLLIQLAKRHSRHDLDIPPRLYAVWLDCLIETVRRFDSKFNDNVAAAWRTIFSAGIEFMTSRYQSE